MTGAPDDILTLREAEALTGLSVGVWKHAIRRGEVPGSPVRGRGTCVSRRAALSYAARRAKGDDERNGWQVGITRAMAPSARPVSGRW